MSFVVCFIIGWCVGAGAFITAHFELTLPKWFYQLKYEFGSVIKFLMEKKK